VDKGSAPGRRHTARLTCRHAGLRGVPYSRRDRHPEPVGADAPDRGDLGESTARRIARPTSEE
jgi:hypothetical protein